MIRRAEPYFIAALLALTPACGAIKGIFKAGMWVGVIGVVLVLALGFAVVRKFKRGP